MDDPSVRVTRTLVERRDRLADLLARRRVSLGFVSAIVTLVLARPTWDTWRTGLLIAVAGECLRLWAAGHLEKGREVTRSGPYRLLRHPLYAGSIVIAVGVAFPSRSVAAAVLGAVYMGLTIAAAIQLRARAAEPRIPLGWRGDCRIRAACAEDSGARIMACSAGACPPKQGRRRRARRSVPGRLAQW